MDIVKLDEKILDGGMEGVGVTIDAARGESIPGDRLKAAMGLMRAALQIRRELGIESRFGAQKNFQIMKMFFENPEDRLEYIKVTNPEMAKPLQKLLPRPGKKK